MVEIHEASKEDHEKHRVKSAGAPEGDVQRVGEGICFGDIDECP